MSTKTRKNNLVEIENEKKRLKTADGEARSTILTQLKNENGELLGTTFNLPINTSVDNLQTICNMLQKNNEKQLYSFYINDVEITDSLESTLTQGTLDCCESVVDIVYQPQASFRVRAVTRCTSSLAGHADAILDVQFSPDGSSMKKLPWVLGSFVDHPDALPNADGTQVKQVCIRIDISSNVINEYLASSSGDTTVRFWDVNTETPQHTCKAHKHWVLFLAWSPCGKKLASGCKSGQICIWDPQSGKQLGKTLTGHTQWIMCLVWKPIHLDGSCRTLASSSKDATVRIWDVVLGHVLLTLACHLQSVTCIRWSGSNLIYSSSQDGTIKVWRPNDGVLCRTLQGHASWVNHIALSTDYVMRTGSFDPANASINHTDTNYTDEEMAARALERYNKAISLVPEKMVSCSDDRTLSLWTPSENNKPVAKMGSHIGIINEAVFSPDGRLIASASYDKSVKIWDGLSGKLLSSLLGHVKYVYQVSWSADSRLLCSSSADSTLKIWNVKADKKKLLFDLPGHADEVYAIDWSPDGQRVVSGGKDKVLKIWKR